MEGPNLTSGTTITNESGILPRAVDFIFKEKKRLEYQGKKIDLQMACLEIYNDNLSDLLSIDVNSKDNSGSGSGNNSHSNGFNGIGNNSNSLSSNDRLSISYQHGKVIVGGLTWINIQDNQQLLDMVVKASKTRMVEKTNWNERLHSYLDRLLIWV